MTGKQGILLCWPFHYFIILVANNVENINLSYMYLGIE